jgi:putative transcriptional regulator
MGDPSFKETVILVVRDDPAHGVVGLVLNRRTDLPMSRVLDLKAAKDRSDPVYAGGPVVQQEVFALMKSREKDEKVFGQVAFISGKEQFEKALGEHPVASGFRVYLGYTGWTEAQLRSEVRVGAWVILPADEAAVFSDDPGDLWMEMMERTKLQVAEAGRTPLMR